MGEGERAESSLEQRSRLRSVERSRELSPSAGFRLGELGPVEGREPASLAACAPSDARRDPHFLQNIPSGRKTFPQEQVVEPIMTSPLQSSTEKPSPACLEIDDTWRPECFSSWLAARLEACQVIFETNLLELALSEFSRFLGELARDTCGEPSGEGLREPWEGLGDAAIRFPIFPTRDAATNEVRRVRSFEDCL